jgi:hypothetical protein
MSRDRSGEQVSRSARPHLPWRSSRSRKSTVGRTGWSSTARRRMNWRSAGQGSRSFCARRRPTPSRCAGSWTPSCEQSRQTARRRSRADRWQPPPAAGAGSSRCRLGCGPHGLCSSKGTADSWPKPTALWHVAGSAPMNRLARRSSSNVGRPGTTASCAGWMSSPAAASSAVGAGAPPTALLHPASARHSTSSSHPTAVRMTPASGGRVGGFLATAEGRVSPRSAPARASNPMPTPRGSDRYPVPAGRCGTAPGRRRSDPGTRRE